MLKNLTLALLAVCVLASCGTQSNDQTANQNTDPTKDGKHFGAVINADNAVTYDALMASMGALDSMPAKVTGKVKEVCQTKGCWMTIVSDDPAKPEMRVTFKDYAFFMPKDLSGQSVVIDGYAFVDVTPVDVLRHYAEDAGKSKAEIEAITEPKRELGFVASCVLILQQ